MKKEFTFNDFEKFANGPRKGMPKTLTDRVIRYLIEDKEMHETLSNSGKYRQFEYPNMDIEDKFYFVGKNGSVRIGKNSSNSISRTDFIHNRMRTFEKEKYPEEVWK